jgi:glycosyltransferase involved in cell wall biosynthesis
MTLVSVIIPNYNHSRYLKARIDSVLNQTFNDFEVIILDDYSSDSSREVIETYRGHAKIRQIVFNSINSGSTFHQWLKGIGLATGQFIWIAESDDVADAGFLETTVALLRQNPNTGIVYCQSAVIDGQGNLLRNNLSWTDDLDPERWKRSFEISGDNAISDYLYYKNIIPNASAVLFRKDIFEKLTTEFTSYRYVGDWLVWINILKLSGLAFCEQTLNYFRYHGDVSRVHKSRESAMKYLREYYDILHLVRPYIMNDSKKLRMTYNRFADRMIATLGYRFIFTVNGMKTIREFAVDDKWITLRLLRKAFRSLGKSIGGKSKGMNELAAEKKI